MDGQVAVQLLSEYVNMRFTKLLRDGQSNYENVEYGALPWEHSAAIKAKDSDLETTLKQKRRLTWNKFTGHLLLKPPDKIKESFNNFLSMSSQIFSEVDASKAAYYLFKAFNTKEWDLDKLSSGSDVKKNDLESCKKEARALFEWYTATSGQLYSFDAKRAPKSEYGKSIDFNDPFAQTAESPDAEEKYSVKWLWRICADCNPRHEAVARIIKEISSDKNNDEIQDGLFGILGESNVGAIAEIVLHRKAIVSETEGFVARGEGNLNTSFDEMELKGGVARDIILPENTVHTFTKDHEEFEIPARTKAAFDGNLVSVDSVDACVRDLFEGLTHFNPVQSKSFGAAFQTSENLLVCAPTGAGKTNVALLAIARQIKLALQSEESLRPKIVYVTPMKALAREITAKFSRVLRSRSLKCAEYTGDMHLSKRQIEQVDVIVATPEKWDVATRKESQVVREVRLLIVDEIHLLNEERGAVIESIIARTKILIEKAQTHIRIVGLSATLPNYKDVATFLGVNKVGLLYFGDEYRPIPLDYSFVGVSDKLNFYSKAQQQNSICAEKMLAALQADKQVIIFVHSRKETARLAKWLIAFLGKREMMALAKPKAEMAAREKRLYDGDLSAMAEKGFACHNAGVSRHDRTLVEKLFSSGKVRVLVSTATLAWGVNLPAHTVIIKGTTLYNPEKGGFVNLGGLDVMQIFGRAGRPQFDSSGRSVLITTKKLLPTYMRLLTAQTPIESRFISCIEDNLNAEVVSGTVSNLDEAVSWLAYTYLFIRMLRNPLAYGIPFEEVSIDGQLIYRRQQIVASAAKNLSRNRIMRFEKNFFFYPTNVGRIASHYYIHHRSMNLFLERIRSSDGFLGDEETLLLIASASEFAQIQVRDEELEELALLELPVRASGKGDDQLNKVSMLIQCYICHLKMRAFTLISDMQYIAQNVGRITRALFEICLSEGRPALARHFLAFAKMVELRVWKGEHVLAQFNALDRSIARKLRDRKIKLSSLVEYDLATIGHLISNHKKAISVKRLAHCLPRLDASVVVSPVSRSVLRIKAGFLRYRKT